MAIPKQATSENVFFEAKATPAFVWSRERTTPKEIRYPYLINIFIIRFLCDANTDIIQSHLVGFIHHKTGMKYCFALTRLAFVEARLRHKMGQGKESSDAVIMATPTLPATPYHASSSFCFVLSRGHLHALGHNQLAAKMYDPSRIYRFRRFQGCGASDTNH